MQLSNETLTIMINDVKEDIKAVKDDIKGLSNKMDLFIDNADKKYASKTVEKVVYSMIGAICVAVLGAMLNLVIK